MTAKRRTPALSLQNRRGAGIINRFLYLDKNNVTVSYIMSLRNILYRQAPDLGETFFYIIVAHAIIEFTECGRFMEALTLYSMHHGGLRRSASLLGIYGDVAACRLALGQYSLFRRQVHMMFRLWRTGRKARKHGDHWIPGLDVARPRSLSIFLWFRRIGNQEIIASQKSGPFLLAAIQSRETHSSREFAPSEAQIVSAFASAGINIFPDATSSSEDHFRQHLARLKDAPKKNWEAYTQLAEELFFTACRCGWVDDVFMPLDRLLRGLVKIGWTNIDIALIMPFIGAALEWSVLGWPPSLLSRKSNKSDK